MLLISLSSIVLMLSFCFLKCLADDPNRLPTRCETCKYLSNEIAVSLLKHNSYELIETGYNIDERLNKKKHKKYRDSEVRLIEVVESVCEQILDYNVHAERSGSLRYSKGESQTMGTLKGLRNKGVKVELGIPYDLWDTPSAEITQLKKYCDNMVETYESEIEDWFMNHRDNVTLTHFLCENIILKNDDKSCLNEVFIENKEDEQEKEKREKERKREQEKAKKKEKQKGDKGETESEDKKNKEKERIRERERRREKDIERERRNRREKYEKRMEKDYRRGHFDDHKRDRFDDHRRDHFDDHRRDDFDGYKPEDNYDDYRKYHDDYDYDHHKRRHEDEF